jgi:hypothetical protein
MDGAASNVFVIGGLLSGPGGEMVTPGGGLRAYASVVEHCCSQSGKRPGSMVMLASTGSC